VPWTFRGRGAGQPARATDTEAYRRFWAEVGRHFPDLGGAASTRYYSDNERRLFAEHFPALRGLSIFKTDLWDEARNTRILAWAGEQGARVYGIDISEPTLIQARAAFERHPNALHGAVADLRALPFRDASFDAVYSMGTIEHFDETERAVEEIARVLKPGGRAIIGVPNRYDPFLRPLVVSALQALGLYAYGYEKSYSRRALREMLERAGFAVVAETAILFIPGWLRMLDLACHAWCRPLTAVTSALVWPFAFLDRHLPAVRRHGYLLATVVVKPERPNREPASTNATAPTFN
jgi:SAM-dependent methyltransferase